MRFRFRLRPSAGVPQASLPDIAFLLLIFFISTTIFDEEVGIPLVLPGAGSPRVQVLRSNVIVIEGEASGEVRVDGEAVPLSRVHEIVRERLDQNPRAIVSIETARRAPYGVMIGVLDEVKKARAERISLRLGEGP